MSTIITRRKQSAASIRLPKRAAVEAEALPRATRSRSASSRAARRGTETAVLPPLAGPRVATRPWERILFAVALVAFVMLASLYIGTKVTTKQARFDITDMKKQELILMKERERLQEQVSGHKKPERIEERARKRGMVTPGSGQVVTVP